MSEKTMNGMLNGSESVRQAIYHILHTERYSNPIYGRDYGVELQSLVGKGMEYVEAHIQRVLKEALTQDDRITDVRVDDVRKDAVDTLSVEFTVYTIYGESKEELEIVQ